MFVSVAFWKRHGSLGKRTGYMKLKQHVDLVNSKPLFISVTEQVIL